MKKKLLLYLLPFAVCCLVVITACSKDTPKQPVRIPVVPVTTAPVINRSVPVQLLAIGTVEAYSSVKVTSRVGGELLSVGFSEGKDVKKGELLFTIDPAPYQAAYDIALANLTRDMAVAKKADDDLIRYNALFGENLVSINDLEKVRTGADAAAATAAGDRAAVENAKLQLGYCYIYAPVSGRTGGLLVNKGNLIKANDDKPMVIINQVQPVYVSFSVPEHNLSEIRRYMASGRLNVGAMLSKEENVSENGLLTFIDNTVDISTGTIKLKATFDNKELVLWPGQFVNITIALFTIQDAVVVPSQAVQTGQQGQFVFVIKEDTAELRPVTAGITHEGMTVIEKGLSSDEVVVTDGQMLLMPGAKVEIKNN